MTEWTDCQFLRPIGPRSCVVRLEKTGAILQITLREPLDITRACLACPTKPIPARVRLAEDLAEQPCELAIAWPESAVQPMPAPLRFVRKTRGAPRKTKRQRPN